MAKPAQDKHDPNALPSSSPPKAIAAAKKTPVASAGAPSSSRALLIDVALIATAHALVCLIIRLVGFDHISDDDFARVSIAQAFAHRPKLDPTGTSWLPFPFWLLGGFMAVVGRSLTAARVLSVLFSSLAAALPYLALRYSGVPRTRSLIATAFAFVTPWSIWLGATTVPESFTASLVAAGALGLASSTTNEGTPDAERSRRARITWLCALAIVAACLSRYEPWPAAAVLGLGLDLRMIRGPKRMRAVWLVAGFICALGPLLWMAWNAHAHDGPLHFFRRVSTFKQAIGEGSTNALGSLLYYPRLLLTTRPEVIVPALLLLRPALLDPAIRHRWGLPLASAGAQIAFVSYGNMRDGAAAHHPERALLGPLMILALFAGDVGWATMTDLLRRAKDQPAEMRRRQTRLAMGGIACVSVLWLASLVRDIAEMPGRSESDDRREQVARGQKLRAEGARSLVIRPCGFEHFALLAAYAAPENADVKTRSGTVVNADCPQVESKQPSSTPVD